MAGIDGELAVSMRVTRYCNSSPRSISNTTLESSRRCQGGMYSISPVKIGYQNNLTGRRHAAAVII
jgi:hypothetical protein